MVVAKGALHQSALGVQEAGQIFASVMVGESVVSSRGVARVHKGALISARHMEEANVAPGDN